MATYYAQKKEKVLVVQWSLSDIISPLFSQTPTTHQEQSISFHFASMPAPSQFLTMNYDVDESIREYFVEHLKMKLLYSVVVQNKHVQKLVHAAPGVAELFFLGRLFWLVELAQQEHGVFYDRIIVDTPATGHGVSLFGIARAVSSFGITGPLAMECDRVARLLADDKKTGIILVTLPEELPSEETMETYPKLVEKLGYKPLCLLVNQSVSPAIYPQLNGIPENPYFQKLLSSLESDEAKQDLATITSGLVKRNVYEDKLSEFAKANGLPKISLPDFNLIQKKNSSFSLLENINQYLIQLESQGSMPQ